MKRQNGPHLNAGVISGGDSVRKVTLSSPRFWPMLPSRSGPDANRIRLVYWVGSKKPNCRLNYERNSKHAITKRELHRHGVTDVFVLAEVF